MIIDVFPRVACMALLNLMVNCGGGGPPIGTSEQSQPGKDDLILFDEVSVQELLQPGIPEDAVVRYFGNPTRKVDLPDGESMLEFESDYIMHNRIGTGSDFRLYGVRVICKDRRLVRWLGNYRSIEK
ncbi:MAG: hypothetical protein ACOYMN_21835 [Roseimicrobium sp.]